MPLEEVRAQGTSGDVSLNLTKEKEIIPFSRKEQLYLMISLSTTLHLALFLHAKSSEHKKSLTHRAAVMTTTQACGLENRFVETGSTRLLPKL